MISVIKMSIQTTSLIITPLTNLDFDSNELKDNMLIEELEVEPKTQLPLFNSVKQRSESKTIDFLKEYHWYMRGGSLYKIIHVLK